MFNIFKKTFSNQLDNNSLSNLIKSGALLVDVRTQSEFRDGNVKGSINIPLDQIQKQISKFKNYDNIIVFCRSGNRSSHAKSILEQYGIMNVTNGGSWQNVNQYVEQ